MAIDKAVDSTQLDTYLTAVANAIRAKGSTSALLSFPAGMAQAIAAISGGGLPDVRKFQVATDSTLGTYGGISFPVVSSGIALYLIVHSHDTTHFNTTARYPRGVLIGIQNGLGGGSPLCVRYDNSYTQVTGATYSNNVATILGTSICRFTDSYTLDVYEVVLE